MFSVTIFNLLQLMTTKIVDKLVETNREKVLLTNKQISYTVISHCLVLSFRVQIR